MDIGRCLNDAVDVYKRNLVALVVAAFLYEILTLASLTILAGPLAVGWCIMSLNALRNQDKRVNLGDLFSGFRRFWSTLGLFYITFVAIVIGLVLCIVPGFLLMTIWIFSFFLLADQNEGVIESLQVSYRLVKRSGFGKYLLLSFIVFALSVAPELIPYLGFVISWFAMPLAWLMEASAYIQEVDEKKPLSKPAPPFEASE